MPVMPRLHKKFVKIAQKINGKPSNFIDIRSPEKDYINKRLIADETYRVR